MTNANNTETQAYTNSILRDLREEQAWQESQARALEQLGGWADDSEDSEAE